MKKLFILSTLLSISATIFADNTDEGKILIQGKVIRSIAIESFSITMPDARLFNSVLGTTLSMTCDSSGSNKSSYTPHSGKVQFQSKGACGKTTVLGEPNFSYTIAVAPVDSASDISLSSVDCVSVSSHRSEQGVIGVSGVDTVYCGATISVAASLTPATNEYSLLANLTVTYD